MRKQIERTMKEDVKCNCAIRFYGGIRENQLHATVYVYCGSKTHEQWFLCHLVNYRRFNIAQIHVYSNKNEICARHDYKAGSKVYPQLRGSKRNEIKQELRKKRVKDYQDDVFLNAITADVNDGDFSNFARDNTLHQIKCEDRKENRLVLKSKD